MDGWGMARISPTGDIARTAFDTAAALARADSPAALDAVMRPILQALGFYSYNLTETKNGVTRVTAGMPPALCWRSRAQSDDARDDVVLLQARASADAFFYSEVTEAPNLTPTQKRIVDERKSLGILNGFVNPIHRPGGILSAVIFIGGQIDARAPDLRAAALVISDAYNLAVGRLAAPAAPVITLTSRQRDCLAWVREGKSATDIGAILGISVHTVQEHVAEACRRLGVRTRVQAVAAAMAWRLIDP